MGKLRYYDRDPHAALDGMMELTLEERGAYNTVLDLIYARDGAVDDDDRFIAGWLRCDVRFWRRIRQRLLDTGKIYLQDGAIRNTRADVVVAKALSRIGSASDAGKTSARKRAAKKNENKDLDPTPVEQPSQPLSLSVSKKDSVANATDAGASAVHPPIPIPETPEARLWRLGKIDLIALGVPEKRVGGLIGSWRRDTGEDCERVLGAIMRAREYAVSEPIAWITAALKTRKPNAKSETILGAADDLVESIRKLNERPGGIRSGEGAPTLRLLPSG